MAIVKCMNPECDYFERAVPEGDCCPYCGELLNVASPVSQPEFPAYDSPVEPPPVVSPVPPQKAPIRTVVEPIEVSLKLVHEHSDRVFTIERYRAINKVYLGRQDGIQSDRPIVDVSSIPFAERVSRFHAYISWDNSLNCFNISDDNSTNGTILNGQSLTPQQSYPLHTGDRLELGREQKLIFTVEIS